MAGGLFNRPFSFNLKCIIFSLLCMALLLIKPNFNNNYYLYFTLFLVFVLAYVGMAWYDYFFNCDILPLEKGKIGGITGQLKPKSHSKDKQENGYKTDLDSKRHHLLIYLSHLLFIVPLLLYIAYYKDKINNMVYPILGVLAVFTAGYHGISLMTFNK